MYVFQEFKKKRRQRWAAMSALKFTVLAECSTSRARTSLMELPHAQVDTPVFMPVGTQGTLKGLITEQLERMDCRIMLVRDFTEFFSQKIIMN